MTFHADAFASASLSMPEQDVGVPCLSPWFDDCDAKVWRLRGLNANQLIKVELAPQRRQNRLAMQEALDRGNYKEIVSSTRDALGLDPEEIEPLYVRKIEAIVLGVVEPKVSHQHVAKMGECFPLYFDRLWRVLNELTGEGASAEKKPKRSGKPPESATPAPSAGSSENPSTSSDPTSSPAAA